TGGRPPRTWRRSSACCGRWETNCCLGQTVRGQACRVGRAYARPTGGNGLPRWVSHTLDPPYTRQARTAPPHSKLVQPEVEPAVVALRVEPLVAPVRLGERRVRHVPRRSHVRRARRLRPLRRLLRPVVVREVVVGVVEVAPQLRVRRLGTGRRRTAGPQAQAD